MGWPLAGASRFLWASGQRLGILHYAINETDRPLELPRLAGACGCVDRTGWGSDVSVSRSARQLHQPLVDGTTVFSRLRDSAAGHRTRVDAPRQDHLRAGSQWRSRACASDHRSSVPSRGRLLLHRSRGFGRPDDGDHRHRAACLGQALLPRRVAGSALRWIHAAAAVSARTNAVRSAAGHGCVTVCMAHSDIRNSGDCSGEHDSDE